MRMPLLPLWCVQDMGQNVLAAIQEFSRVLATNPATPTVETAGGGSVYFDLWGKAMVRWEGCWDAGMFWMGRGAASPNGQPCW